MCREGERKVREGREDEKMWEQKRVRENGRRAEERGAEEKKRSGLTSRNRRRRRTVLLSERETIKRYVKRTQARSDAGVVRPRDRK